MRGADPKYEEEVSGCTASVGIITKDKVYVVCPSFGELCKGYTDLCRAMRVTRDPSSASKAVPSPSPSTTSPRMRVKRHEFAPLVGLLTSEE